MSDYKFPTEVVDLPSKGYFYPESNPLSSGKVEMKYMTAREEDILTSPNLLKSGLVLDKLLESLIIDKKINCDDLLIGDKNGLIIAARILAYGKDYAFEYTDDDRTVRQSTYDLTTAKDKKIDFNKMEKGRNEFSFELPNSNRILTFKLLNQKDEYDIQSEIKARKKMSDGSIQYELTTRLKKMILSVDGKSDKATINSFVDNEFLSIDSLEFRNYVQSLMPDVEMLTTIKFSSGEESEVSVPMTVGFFWPSSTR